MNLTTSKLSSQEAKNTRADLLYDFMHLKDKNTEDCLLLLEVRLSGCPETGHRVLCAGYWACQKSSSGILMIYIFSFLFI